MERPKKVEERLYQKESKDLQSKMKKKSGKEEPEWKKSFDLEENRAEDPIFEDERTMIERKGRNISEMKDILDRINESKERKSHPGNKARDSSQKQTSKLEKEDEAVEKQFETANFGGNIDGEKEEKVELMTTPSKNGKEASEKFSKSSQKGKLRENLKSESKQEEERKNPSSRKGSSVKRQSTNAGTSKSQTTPFNHSEGSSHEKKPEFEEEETLVSGKPPQSFLRYSTTRESPKKQQSQPLKRQSTENTQSNLKGQRQPAALRQSSQKANVNIWEEDELSEGEMEENSKRKTRFSIKGATKRKKEALEERVKESEMLA